MKTSSVMSLVAATMFAVGIAGPAVAQTSTPAPAPATPKSGDAQMEKTDKMEKKDSKGAHKQHSSKKKAAKKSDETKASESKTTEQPKK